ncbi:MAG TPA: hypothetical protein VJ045_01385 [Hyphomicrobiaceae bacterium]|nr:hypothetical protein [Hyphomicrobiaceae bacterium]
MHVAFYWLEDYFDALALKCQGRLARSAADFLSAIFSVIGDALNMQLWTEPPSKPSNSQ